MQNNIMIVDFEATCCANNEFPRYEMEIIEIGAVNLEISTGKIIDTYQGFIRPSIHPILTTFCKELTGIKQSDIDEAPMFLDAYKAWYKWLEDNNFTHNDAIWGSWGYFDKKILIANIQMFAQEFPVSDYFENHYNLKERHMKNKGLSRGAGLAGALKMEGLTFEGDHHRALDDAKNIARLCNYFGLGGPKL